MSDATKVQPLMPRYATPAKIAPPDATQFEPKHATTALLHDDSNTETLFGSAHPPAAGKFAIFNGLGRELMTAKAPPRAWQESPAHATSDFQNELRVISKLPAEMEMTPPQAKLKSPCEIACVSSVVTLRSSLRLEARKAKAGPTAEDAWPKDRARTFRNDKSENLVNDAKGAKKPAPDTRQRSPLQLSVTF